MHQTNCFLLTYSPGSMASQRTQLFSCIPEEMQYNSYIPLLLPHVTPIYAVFLYTAIRAQTRLWWKRAKENNQKHA